LIHDRRTTAVGADGQATAEDFSEARQVGRDPADRLIAAEPDPEAGDHFVEDQQRANAVRDASQSGEKTGQRRDHAHVRSDRFHDDCRGLVVAGGFHGGEIVEASDAREARDLRRYAGTVGGANVIAPEPARTQQAVRRGRGTPGKLHDLLSPGSRSREAKRAHRRLGARADEPHTLDARYQLADSFCEPNLELGGCTEARTAHQRSLDRIDHRRMTMPQNHRPPRADEVDVLSAVDVVDPCAVGALDEPR
jgi:hypothetical protein